MQRAITRRLKLIGIVALAGVAAWAALACQNSGSQGGGLFGGSKEQWTIRCARIESPNHRELADTLAAQLGKVSGLSASKVRVQSDAASSVIYYGHYTKVADGQGGLAFPAEYQRDIEWIRRLAYQNQTPFFFAGPELIAPAEGTPVAGAEGDVSTAKGTHSLQIAVFYNTPEFDQRKEAAEAYVKDLRTRGYPAYYYHETLRSFVMVGDFDGSDLVHQPDGRWVFSARVEQFIARNPDEFKHLTENGMLIKRRLRADEPATPNPSLLIPIPGRAVPTERAPDPRSRDRRSSDPQRLPGEGRY